MESWFIENGNYLVVAGGIISAISGLFLSFIEHNNLRPNKKNIGIITVIGVVITIVGTLYSQKGNDKKTEQIINANKVIDSLTKINNNLSHSNSSKLDISLKNLDSIISKTDSQINKLDIVQKDMINNYETINKETKIVQEKTTSLKYMIDDNFKLYLNLKFKDENLIPYLKSINRINEKSDISNNKFITSCIDDFTIRIEIAKNKKTMSPNSWSASNSLVLSNIEDFRKNKKISYANYTQCCPQNDKFIEIELSEIPLHISSSDHYKSLSELKGSILEVYLDYNYTTNNSPDPKLTDLLNKNVEIGNLVIRHKYDWILGCIKFEQIKKNSYSTVFRSIDVNYLPLK